MLTNDEFSTKRQKFIEIRQQRLDELNDLLGGNPNIGTRIRFIAETTDVCRGARLRQGTFGTIVEQLYGDPTIFGVQCDGYDGHDFRVKRESFRVLQESEEYDLKGRYRKVEIKDIKKVVRHAHVAMDLPEIKDLVETLVVTVLEGSLCIPPFLKKVDISLCHESQKGHDTVLEINQDEKSLVMFEYTREHTTLGFSGMRIFKAGKTGYTYTGTLVMMVAENDKTFQMMKELVSDRAKLTVMARQARHG